MRTLVVVNGEQDWPRYLPGCTVHHRRLQTSHWLFHNGQLWVFDASGSIREAGLPVPEMTVALGEGMLDRFEPALPTVVKMGNYHGGYGKARPRDAEEWADVKDLAFAVEDYVTVEPYIAYARDIRCLTVGERMWAMARRGRFWKANTATEHHEMVAVPDTLRAYTTRAMEHLQADVLGLDFLETADGTYILLESNDTPGLAGFPEEARLAMASLVRDKINA